MEGQTSTADGDDLAALAKEQRRQAAAAPKKETVADIAFASLAKLIEDTADQPEAPEIIPMPAKSHRLGAALSGKHGWPVRVLQASHEPTDGGGWKAAYALASPVIERGGIAVFHGTRGTGKTRMAGELARNVPFPFDTGSTPAGVPVEKHRTAVYRTAMGFFTEIRATYRKESPRSEAEVIESLTEPGLLVIDELQERGESAFEDRLLTHLIDRRYGAMLPTILICNLTKEQLFQTVSASVADRIAENGIRLEFNWPSFRRKQ